MFVFFKLFRSSSKVSTAGPAGLVSSDELRAIEKEIDSIVQDCVDFALSAPEPDPSELTRYIWAED